MIGAAIIEVVIGLVFIFILMSILVTQINTIIINLLNLKAKRLKEQLDIMLTDPVIRTKILTHPLIGMVETPGSEIVLTSPTERITAQAAQELTEGKRARVSYIETATFVDVLVDVLTANTGQKLYEELNRVVDRMDPSVEKSVFRDLIRQIQLKGTGIAELRGLIATMANADDKRQMLVALNLVDTALDKLQVESSDLIPLHLGVRQIRDQYLQTALEAVLTTAHSLQDAQEKLGQWFDSGINRAREVYTRQMQRISIIIGLLLAVILNVDTLFIGRVLWEDPALRAAVATAAEASVPTLEEQISQRQPDPTQPPAQSLDEATLAARSIFNTLLNLRLPLGWGFTPLETGMAEASRDDGRNLWLYGPANNPDWLGLWLRKAIGLIVTTIAVAQGAPFWFDFLRRITNRGGSG